MTCMGGSLKLSKRQDRQGTVLTALVPYDSNVVISPPPAHTTSYNLGYEKVMDDVKNVIVLNADPMVGSRLEYLVHQASGANVVLIHNMVQLKPELEAKEVDMVFVSGEMVAGCGELHGAMPDVCFVQVEVHAQTEAEDQQVLMSDDEEINDTTGDANVLKLDAKLVLDASGDINNWQGVLDALEKRKERQQEALLKRLVVFACEDDKVIHTIMKRFVVKHLHPDSRMFYDGRDMLEYLEANPGVRYDLSLLDCMMRFVDGDKLCSILREKGVTTPIIALTGNSLVEKDNLFAHGFDDILYKPFKSPALIELLIKYHPENNPKSEESRLANAISMHIV